MRLTPAERKRTNRSDRGRIRPVQGPVVEQDEVDALLARMSRAANGDRILRYYHGDRQGKPSASEALLGLAQLSAFWIGPVPERLEAFLRTSRLWADAEFERAKWDSPRGEWSWGVRYVVLKAIGTCGAFHPGTGYSSTFSLSSSLPQHNTKLCKTGVRFDALRRVWVRVAARPLPKSILSRVKSRKRAGLLAKRRLAAFCLELSRDRGGRFFLSSIDAGKLTGVDRSNVSRWLTEFATPKVGLIRRTRRGNSKAGLASEYQWTGPTE